MEKYLAPILLAVSILFGMLAILSSSDSLFSFTHTGGFLLEIRKTDVTTTTLTALLFR